MLSLCSAVDVNGVLVGLDESVGGDEPTRNIEEEAGDDLLDPGW